MLTVVCTNNELKLLEGVGPVDRLRLESSDRAWNERERETKYAGNTIVSYFSVVKRFL